MSFWRKLKQILRGLLRIDDCCNKLENQKKTLVKLQKMVKENQRKLDTEWKVLKHYLNQEFASVQKKFNSVQKDYSSVQKEFPGIQKAVRDVKNSQNAKTFFVYI